MREGLALLERGGVHYAVYQFAKARLDAALSSAPSRNWSRTSIVLGPRVSRRTRDVVTMVEERPKSPFIPAQAGI